MYKPGQSIQRILRAAGTAATSKRTLTGRENKKLKPITLAGPKVQPKVETK